MRQPEDPKILVRQGTVDAGTGQVHVKMGAGATVRGSDVGI